MLGFETLNHCLGRIGSPTLQSEDGKRGSPPIQSPPLRIALPHLRVREVDSDEQMHVESEDAERPLGRQDLNDRSQTANSYGDRGAR